MEVPPVASVFTIEDFAGYLQGIGRLRTPPGALVDVGQGLLLQERTLNVHVSSAGEIAYGGGYSLLARLSNLITPANCTGIYYWKPAHGGSRLVLSKGSNFYYLGMTDPGAIPAIYTPSLHAYTDTYSMSRLAAPPGSGCFVPFGEALFYTDMAGNKVGGVRLDWIGATNITPMGMKPPTNQVNAVISGKVGISSIPSPSSFRYAFTFVSERGESVPHLIQSNRPTAQGIDYFQTCRLSVDWPDCPAFVRGVNIYRYEPTVGAYCFLRYIPKSADHYGFYLDMEPTAGLGYQLDLTSQRPARFRLLCAAQNRMWAVGGYTNYDRVCCSKENYPDIWPTQNEVPYVAPPSAGSIMAIRELNGVLFLFFERAIMRLYGNSPDTYGFEVISDTVGLRAPNSMFPCKGGLIFLGQDGIYSFDGNQPALIAPQLPGIFQRTSRGAESLFHACGAVTGDYYLLSYYEADERGQEPTVLMPYPNRVLVLNVVTGRIGVRNHGAFSVSTPFERGDSIVLGPPTVVDSSYTYLYLLSDYRDQDARHDGQSGVTHYMSFCLTGLTLGSAERFKNIESVEIHYEASHECAGKVTLIRTHPVAEADADHNYREVWTVASDVAPSTVAKWGASWTDKSYALIQPRTLKAHFTRMYGQVFDLAVQFTTKAPEIRVLRVAIRYHVEGEWRGTAA